MEKRAKQREEEGSVVPVYFPSSAVADFIPRAVGRRKPPYLLDSSLPHRLGLLFPPLSVQAWGSQWRLNVASISQAHHVAVFLGPLSLSLSFSL